MREAYGNHEANQKYEAENILEELEGQKRLNEPSHNISFSDYDDSDDNETFHTHPNNSILSDVYPVSPDHDMVDDNIMVTEETSTLLNEGNEVYLEERPVPVVDAGRDDNVKEPEKGGKSSKKRKKTVVNHPMLDACKCENKCAETICSTVRQNIHTKYWGMSYAKQQDWIWGNMKTSVPKRIRVRSEIRKRRRARATSYYLPKEGEDVKVCLTFFCLLSGIRVTLSSKL